MKIFWESSGILKMLMSRFTLAPFDFGLWLGDSRSVSEGVVSSRWRNQKAKTENRQEQASTRPWFPRSALEPNSRDALRPHSRRNAERSHAEHGNEGYVACLGGRGFILFFFTGFGPASISVVPPLA